MSNTCAYSVVIPVFNEESCVEIVLKDILQSIEPLGKDYEIICVDDCSTDSSWEIISSFSQKHPQIKGIRFSRNFGHQLAVHAGIKQSTGKYVAVLDADGQDPPEILPDMFKKCENGYDVVYAIRTQRKEAYLKKAAYKLFYIIYKKIVPFYVPVDSGDFAVFTQKIAKFIGSLDEKKPFIRGLRNYYGGKQIGYEYERKKRISGKTKYSLFKLILLALNGATTFSKIPLRLISIFGITISLASFLSGLYLLLRKLTVGIDLLGWTSTTILIIFFGGLNMLVLGIIGEYIGDIFDETKNRPPYLIDQHVGY